MQKINQKIKSILHTNIAHEYANICEIKSRVWIDITSQSSSLFDE